MTLPTTQEGKTVGSAARTFSLYNDSALIQRQRWHSCVISRELLLLWGNSLVPIYEMPGRKPRTWFCIGPSMMAHARAQCVPHRVNKELRKGHGIVFSWGYTGIWCRGLISQTQCCPLTPHVFLLTPEGTSVGP